MKQYVYETEIFDTKTKTLEDYLLAQLDENLSEQVKYGITVHGQMRELQDEISELKKLEGEISPITESEIGVADRSARLNELYIVEAQSSLNAKSRRCHYLIRKNQELLSYLIEQYEEIVVTDDENPHFQQAINSMRKIVTNRISELDNTIEDIAKQKKMLHSETSGINVVAMTKIKEEELANLRAREDEITKKKRLIKIAMVEIRKKKAQSQ